jgi:DNA-binding response OmpR family regulator
MAARGGGVSAAKVPTAKILVVEDDESLGMVLSDALKQEGHRVHLERDGAKAAEAATARRWDLILLDLMLPHVDGLEICRRVRAKGLQTPVLMLTARGREEDRVQGLDLGADDYLVKPFGMRELLARVRARLRQGAPPPASTLRFGAADVDLGAMLSRRGGRETPLTKTEAGLVRLFSKHPRVVLTRNRFLDEVWGYDRYPTTRTVDMHVARLREKIGDDGAAPRFIVTVHGVGYRYDPDGQPENVASA